MKQELKDVVMSILVKIGRPAAHHRRQHPALPRERTGLRGKGAPRRSPCRGHRHGREHRGRAGHVHHPRLQ